MQVRKELEDERRKVEDLERELHAVKTKTEAESAMQRETIETMKESVSALSNTEKSLREQLQKTQVRARRERLTPWQNFRPTSSGTTGLLLKPGPFTGPFL